jgi:hypothetical protein
MTANRAIDFLRGHLHGDLLDHLAERGLVFQKGAPPKSERENVLLLWTGGCNAVQAFWHTRRRRWVGWGDGEAIPSSTIDCWMRLPHPTFWPTQRRRKPMIRERELHDRRRDVIADWIYGE